MRRKLEHIAVLGAGKMGLGISLCFALKGYFVKVVYVHDDKTRWDAGGILKGNLALLADNGIVRQEDAPQILSRISFVDTIEELGNTDIVFECIIEKLEIKQEYFRQLDALLGPDTILASNTSAISITAIGEKARRRERIIGTHFWDPPFIIPLVEVIRTDYASQQAVQLTCDLLHAAGKKPVLVQKDVPGFLANRMQHALFREALSIVEQGIASPEDVDISIKYGFGMRLGISAPIEVMDRGGLDLTCNIHKYLFPHLADSKEPLPILTDRLAAGQLGFKTGKGLREWSPQEITQSNEALLSGLIQVAKALGRL